jgi:quinoprotein glucose dehydrogenase
VLEWRPSPGDEWREVPETFTFKDGTTRKVATMKKRVKDVVKVLRDTKGQGKWDASEVILEEELPSSILLHDGWLYLSGRGTVRRYRQSKPGGPYDVKEEIARGFCGFHHHQVSGLTLGPDGWLYITSGDDDNYVEGADGSRAVVLRTGAVFRCRPDGSRMQTFALGFRNPYRDVVFDPVGHIFHADNDNEDGSKFTGCRLMHIPEGSDFGWRLRTGARCCSPDPVRGAVYGELPGKVPPLLKTGRGAPAGLLLYHDTRLPENYRGLLFYPDAFRKLIRAYRLDPAGAGFKVVEEFEFLKSDDPLFRPCQMVLGPDGAIYVVDWRTDSGGAGRLWGDGVHGRIYRITWGGARETEAIAPRPLDSWAKIAKQTDEELLKTLTSEDASFRRRAGRELVKRGEKNRAALLKMLGNDDLSTEVRAGVLGVLYSFWNADVQKAVLQALAVGEADIRRLAAEALGRNAAPADVAVHNVLLDALTDDDPAVRRSIALAMGRINAPGAAEVLVNTLAFDNGKDVYLTDGLVRAIEMTGKAGIERLIALCDSGSMKELDRAVEAFCALRTRAGAEALPAILKNPHLSIEQRAAVLRSYGNYLLDPPVSLEPALTYLLDNPREAVAVKLAGLEVLSLAGALQGERGGKLLLELLRDSHSSLRPAVLKAIEEVRLAKAGPELVRLLGDTARPAKEREAAARALRTVGEKSAVPALKALLQEKAELSPERTPLVLEGLRSLAALDADAGVEAARQLLNASDPPLQTEAVIVLGATPAGAREVGELYRDGKLPRVLLSQVSAALRKHASKDPELARLLPTVMRSGLVIGSDARELERVRKLVQEKGNPQRGRTLYLSSKTLACLNCHRLEGVGGRVGPDLTRVWETLSMEKVIESLIDPSKEIKEGYQTYQATTKKGQTHAGLKVAQTAEDVVLRDAQGKDIRIAAADIEELAPTRTSLMPDNVVTQLTLEQFLDLVAFLKSRPAQESVRGLALEYSVVGPFGPDLKAVYPPEEKPDLAARYPGEKPGTERVWQPAQAEPNGYLNLRSLFNRDGASAYALCYVWSPRTQAATVLLGSDGPVRVWVNDRQVHEHASPRRAKPDEDRVEVKLAEGWNRVLLKVVAADGRQGVHLRFQADGLRLARGPQAEDRLP